MSIPNILSLFRLILIPFVAYLFHVGNIKLAGLLFVIACLTDILDGFIARRFNMITNLGKVLDPLADKLMTATVLICLGIKGMVEFWVIAVFFVKDLLMIVGGTLLYNKKIIVPSTWYGKLATTVIWSLVLILLFFSNAISDSLKLFLEGFAAAATIFAMLLYSVGFFKKQFPKFYNVIIQYYQKFFRKK